MDLQRQTPLTVSSVSKYGFCCYRFVRENLDPNFTATLDITCHGDTGCLDLLFLKQTWKAVYLMKTNKFVEDLNKKSDAELAQALVDAKKELFNLRFQNATCVARRNASFATSSDTPAISNITRPGLTTATQYSRVPLPEPIRVSAGFAVTGLSGKALVDAKKELFNLRFQNATNQLDNTARIKDVRRNIARIQTVITDVALIVLVMRFQLICLLYNLIVERMFNMVFDCHNNCLVHLIAGYFTGTGFP